MEKRQEEREDEQIETEVEAEAWAQDVLPMVLNRRGDSGTEGWNLTDVKYFNSGSSLAFSSGLV